jgi:hypothetical protein
VVVTIVVVEVVVSVVAVRVAATAGPTPAIVSFLGILRYNQGIVGYLETRDRTSSKMERTDGKCLLRGHTVFK